MTNSKWVPLTEYSNKYQVSISTLRRRIRSHRVEFIYEDGKYLLKDSPLKDHQPNKHRDGRIVSAPPQPPNTVTSNSSSSVYNQELSQPLLAQPVSRPPKTKPVETQQNTTKDTDMNVVYLNELKKAYSMILQEKEEQVLILKDEVVDLQTLVKVLESENQRLRQELGKSKKNQSSQPESNAALVAAESLYESEWGAELELE